MPSIASQIDVLELERICAVGWPGLVEEQYGQWLVRFAQRFSGRANSVLVLGAPDTDLPQAVDWACLWYRDKQAPPLFQLPTGARVPGDIVAVEQFLARQGWRAGDDVAVLTADLPPVLDRCRMRGGADDLRVQIDAAPSEEWLAGYHYRGGSLPTPAARVLRGGPDPVFVSLHRGDQQLAVARGVVTDGWLGITAVTVQPSARRLGLGTAVMMAVTAWGAEAGADAVYLQVDRQNVGALALYAGLGFTEHHGYRYRLLPPVDG